MSQNNSTITSRIGGVLKNGDTLQYRILMRQSAPRPWTISLWSNPIIVQGLAEGVEHP
jgi:hypothetical protein